MGQLKNMGHYGTLSGNIGFMGQLRRLYTLTCNTDTVMTDWQWPAGTWCVCHCLLQVLIFSQSSLQHRSNLFRCTKRQQNYCWILHSNFMTRT